MSFLYNISAVKRARQLFNSALNQPLPQKELKFSISRENQSEFLIIILITFLAVFISKIFLLLFPTYYIGRKIYHVQIAQIRMMKFERDYPTFLISLSSSVKCGLDPLAALIQTKDLFAINTPIAEAIDQLHQLISSGISEQVAIKDFASQINHPDLILFKDAFILARNQGASLSFCLHRIARVVRARQSFRRKVKIAVAMQKLSAIGILLAVLVMFGVQVLSSYQTLMRAWQDPLGFKLLLLAASLVLIGGLGMLKVSNWEAHS